MININSLMHYGVLGQKWGIRRYQNKDGTLKKLGKSRLGSLSLENTHLKSKRDRLDRKNSEASKPSKKIQKKIDKLDKRIIKNTTKINDIDSYRIERGKRCAKAIIKADDYFKKNGGKFYEAAKKHPDAYKEYSRDFAFDDSNYRKLLNDAANPDMSDYKRRS